MAIDTFIEKVCVQPAVLWSYLGPDGFGSASYSAPIQIYCRWEEKQQLKQDDKKQEYLSRAEILIPQIYLFKTLDFLYLGNMENGMTNPRNVENAYVIRSVEKIPMIFSTTIFVTKAFV